MGITIGIIIAYLLGSLSTAILVSNLLRLPDPRTTGSKNPGATNVLRSGGKTAAIITLIGDVGKGWLPVFVALQLDLFPGWAIGLIGLAAFLGHVFPVYYRLQGGKGVATALGVILAFNPLAGGLVLLTWLLVAAIWRYSSLAALVAAGMAPVYTVFLGMDHWISAAVALMSVILFIRHDSNIRRLMRGEESRIGKKDKSAASTND
ncbi:MULTISPECIES: glycerol-3-phosphate 1-O-acyltransferase PlsY [unclassified Thioalkalivibrio]|uniref:glycerol-3-phosphate 1-O-acyltransferase PlsY n=1 Tax=unclassified Thioalkalivibrio TaxID=2621013 RepID=UPI0003706BAB|nr:MULTISPECIES: glycerol-3-phosphate 1-O-acyltransferase PlsY [unclassified Thioalkalivibrio]